MSLITLVPRNEAVSRVRGTPDYARRKNRYGDELIGLAEKVVPGLWAGIVYRQEATPATNARCTGATNGAIYGPALGQRRLPRKSPVEGLVLAGAGTFPGGGVEAVVISGFLAAEELLQGYRQR